MHEIEVNRNSHLIDPQLHIWGWEVPVYLFLGGLAAGIMIFSALMGDRFPLEQRSRWARWLPFAAPVLLSAGMLALLMDLEYKLHVYRFYLAFRVTSPMSWGSWILLGIYPATIGLGLANLQAEEVAALGNWGPLRFLKGLIGWGHDFANRHRRGVQAANLVLGLGLGIYTGVLLGTLGARPAWNSALLGPLFLVSGLSTGAALMMIFPLAHDEHAWLQRWDMGAIVLEGTLLLFFVVALLTGGGQVGKDAAALFLGGKYTAPFWALVVIAGLAVPLLMELVERGRKLRPTRLAPVLILIGGLSLRWIIVLAGQA